jgi:Uma2 family endonuclease
LVPDPFSVQPSEILSMVTERQSMTHAAVTESLAERLQELGGIVAGRVRSMPAPGTATLEDLVSSNDHSKPLCELIDNTLVEKAVGFEASVVAATMIRILADFVARRRLGIVSGADGMFRLLASSVRGPDVAFLSRDRFPGGQFPQEAYPTLAPDLAIEVLSPGNTKAEMMRKRIEYFHSGVRLVWIVDCRSRSVAVYTSPIGVTVLDEEATITGGDVLPGFECVVADFFSDLDSDSL